MLEAILQMKKQKNKCVSTIKEEYKRMTCTTWEAITKKTSRKEKEEKMVGVWCTPLI